MKHDCMVKTSKTKHERNEQMSKSKNKNEAKSFTINGELAEILSGMEGNNWSIHISKGHRKTVSVTFTEKPATIEVAVKN